MATSLSLSLSLTSSSSPPAWPLTLTVAGHPLSPNARRRSHWAVQRRDMEQFRDAAALLSKAAYHGPPLERARIHATLVRTGGQRYDPDNAVGVLKPILDGLCVRAGGTVLVDDRDIALVVTQETGPVRSVALAVWPLGPDVHSPQARAGTRADNGVEHDNEGVAKTDDKHV